MEVLKESFYSREKSYKLNFPYHGTFANGGFSFPCDKHRNLLTSEMSNPIGMLESYIIALKNPEDFGRGYVSEEVITVKHPALIRCDCGEEMELIPMYCGACSCEKCGQWYNLFGQRIKNPEEWEEPIDYDY